MQELNLQYAPVSVRPVVHVSQFDEGRQFRFALYDGISAVSPPSGATIRVDGIKPDQKGFSYTDKATVSGNVVTVTTTKQMTCVSGRVVCELRVINGGKDEGTLNFDMIVEASPINEGVDISETVLPAIIDMATRQMLNAEAWALGTKNGVPVGSTEPQYHNNAKYYSDESSINAGNAEHYAHMSSDSADSAENSAILSKSWAVGDTGSRVGEDEDNSLFYSRKSFEHSEAALESEQNASASAVKASQSEENAKESEAVLNYYASFVIPRFKLLNNRVYLSDPATREFMADNNRLYIKDGIS